MPIRISILELAEPSTGSRLQFQYSVSGSVPLRVAFRAPVRVSRKTPFRVTIWVPLRVPLRATARVSGLGLSLQDSSKSGFAPYLPMILGFRV